MNRIDTFCSQLADARLDRYRVCVLSASMAAVRSRTACKNACKHSKYQSIRGRSNVSLVSNQPQVISFMQWNMLSRATL